MNKQHHIGMGGHENAQRRLKDRERLKDRQFREDLGAVMGTPHGRRLLAQIIFGHCRHGALSFTGNSETYLNEGRRMVGIQLLGEIQAHHPRLWKQLYDESWAQRIEEEVFKKDAETLVSREPQE